MVNLSLLSHIFLLNLFLLSLLCSRNVLHILLVHRNLAELYVQIQIQYYIFLLFLLYFLLLLVHLKNNHSFLLVILYKARLCQISSCLRLTFSFLFEYIKVLHDCMRLLFLNSVHHLWQLMVCLILLKVLLVFD